MNPLTGILRLLGGVVGLGGKWLDNRAAEEQNTNSEQVAASNQFASEFQYRGQRTWFDVLIDGLNRLPRPFIVFGMIYLMSMSAWDPIRFTQIMTGLALVPEWFALIFGQIILLFFGGRMLDTWKMGTPPTLKQVHATMQTIDALQKMRDERAMRENPPEAPEIPHQDITQSDFDRQMADTGRPLTNAAILEWNRRRQQRG